MEITKQKIIATPAIAFFLSFSVVSDIFFFCDHHFLVSNFFYIFHFFFIFFIFFFIFFIFFNIFTKWSLFNFSLKFYFHKCPKLFCLIQNYQIFYTVAYTHKLKWSSEVEQFYFYRFILEFPVCLCLFIITIKTMKDIMQYSHV